MQGDFLVGQVITCKIAIRNRILLILSIPNLNCFFNWNISISVTACHYDEICSIESVKQFEDDYNFIIDIINKMSFFI